MKNLNKMGLKSLQKTQKTLINRRNKYVNKN